MVEDSETPAWAAAVTWVKFHLFTIFLFMSVQSCVVSQSLQPSSQARGSGSQGHRQLHSKSEVAWVIGDSGSKRRKERKKRLSFDITLVKCCLPRGSRFNPQYYKKGGEKKERKKMWDLCTQKQYVCAYICIYCGARDQAPVPHLC